MFCLDAYYLKDDNDDYPIVTSIREAPQKKPNNPTVSNDDGGDDDFESPLSLFQGI